MMLKNKTKMKIVRRTDFYGEKLNPLSSIIIWLLPLAQYLVLKLRNSIIPNREILWIIIIPVLFIIWIFMNFKIINNTCSK